MGELYTTIHLEVGELYTTIHLEVGELTLLYNLSSGAVSLTNLSRVRGPLTLDSLTLCLPVRIQKNRAGSGGQSGRI